MRNEALVLIEDTCVLMCGSLLSTLAMPVLNRSMHETFNRELQRKQDYDQDGRKSSKKCCTEYPAKKRLRFTHEGCWRWNGWHLLSRCSWWERQDICHFFDSGSHSVEKSNYVSSCILWIVATLLEGGRTAHSALKLPINLLTVDKSTCSVIKNSATAKVMRECKIIIWDECAMPHKKALEAVDRTMQDLRRDSRRLGS